MQSPRPVIVQLTATWCGPCESLGPKLKAVVRAAGNTLRLVVVDVDKCPQVAGGLRVQSVPTVLGVVGGKVVDQFMGDVPADRLQNFVATIGQAA